jgi:hypothetical protein
VLQRVHLGSIVVATVCLLEVGLALTCLLPQALTFDVRKVLKRKEVSRDCMAYSGHGECCIRRCKSSSGVCFMFYAPFSSEDDIAIENSKDSATLLRSEF